MTDRAAKRMRRLSTEYDESEEERMDGNNRYVADCNTQRSRQGQAGAQGYAEKPEAITRA
jgi:hypothetical protein